MSPRVLVVVLVWFNSCFMLDPQPLFLFLAFGLTLTLFLIWSNFCLWFDSNFLVYDFGCNSSAVGPLWGSVRLLLMMRLLWLVNKRFMTCYLGFFYLFICFPYVYELNMIISMRWCFLMLSGGCTLTAAGFLSSSLLLSSFSSYDDLSYSSFLTACLTWKLLLSCESYNGTTDEC